MKLRRIMLVLLALVMTLSTTAFAADTFSDVPEDAYYAAAVQWAVEREITYGKGNGVFDPEATVTRAEAVTFLWRLAGAPEPTQTESFDDVEADANKGWYETAVQWAVQEDITKGTGNGKFSPKELCTRGMILTMLYRMNDCPLDGVEDIVLPENSETWTLEDLGNAMLQMIMEGLRGEDGFADVPEGEFYELPIYWAAISGILDDHHIGEEDHTARPTAPCPRGEMVYFLYRASGEAPVEGAVEIGTIPETVVLEKDGASLTVASLETDDYGDPRLVLRFENGTDKTLQADLSEMYVNTFAVYPQVYVPVEDEEGWVFYGPAVAAPGETKTCFVSLSALEDMGLSAIYELELSAEVYEVSLDEEDYYNYVDDFAAGEPVTIRTSLYADGLSYDREGTTVYDKDGLKVLVIEAENDEYSGPELVLYTYNGGSEEVVLDLAELKLDGKTYDAFCTIAVPAGKRSVDEVYIDFDYENPPVVKEAELIFELVDPETWESGKTLEPLTIRFAD